MNVGWKEGVVNYEGGWDKGTRKKSIATAPAIFFQRRSKEYSTRTFQGRAKRRKTCRGIPYLGPVNRIKLILSCLLRGFAGCEFLTVTFIPQRVAIKMIGIKIVPRKVKRFITAFVVRYVIERSTLTWAR
jgi:hypothetical protein